MQSHASKRKKLHSATIILAENFLQLKTPFATFISAKQVSTSTQTWSQIFQPNIKKNITNNFNIQSNQNITEKSCKYHEEKFCNYSLMPWSLTTSHDRFKRNFQTESQTQVPTNLSCMHKTRMKKIFMQIRMQTKLSAIKGFSIWGNFLQQTSY